MNRATSIITGAMFLFGNVVIFLGMLYYFINTTGKPFLAVLYYSFVLGGSILFFSLKLFYIELTKWSQRKE